MKNSNTIKVWALLITLAILSISLLFGSKIIEGWFALAMIVLLGIPHGATDHILFRHINKDFGKGFMYRFLARYLLLMGLFAMIWWILPLLAFTLFLAISAYHFGQSHWSEINAPRYIKIGLYASWGSFILTALLLINYNETIPIVQDMVSGNISVPPTLRFFIPAFLLLATLIIIIYLYKREKINPERFALEVLTLLVLTLLFLTLPLLASFTIYFVLWHSTLSIKDQVSYFRRVYPKYKLTDFIKQSIPFSLIAFLGILGFSYLSPEPILSTSWIGQFFMLISIVTLPHSILMDSVLDQESFTVDNADSKINRIFSQEKLNINTLGDNTNRFEQKKILS